MEHRDQSTIAVITRIEPRTCSRICERLRENGAIVHALTPEGTLPHDQADKVMKPAKANVTDYDALVVLADKDGAFQLLETMGVDRLADAMLKAEKPVAALDYGVYLLAQMGFLYRRDISCDPKLKRQMESFGANVTDDLLTVDDNLTTAAPTVDVLQFCDVAVESARAHDQAEA